MIGFTLSVQIGFALSGGEKAHYTNKITCPAGGSIVQIVLRSTFSEDVYSTGSTSHE